MRPIKSLSRILVSASGLALATGILAQPTISHAQSFQGTVGSVVGTATVVAGTNTTNVTVSGPSAVINWIPNDNASTGGPIIFQTAGTTATFTGVSGDFAVLNRIIPTGSTRPIRFNGTVRSEIANSGLATPGGTVFFYSPGGILVGSSAIFDIGNLGLTTSDVPYASNGRFDAGVFQPVTIAGSGIRILPGAQINAPVDGSYVALVAPRVENGGSINVNGSAALVAADAATLTFSPTGLFDIQVDSGTSATGTVAANTGSITGSAGTTALNHRIYMVAVAKNEAISMALGSGSTLGFDVAAAADVVGNSIVLSGGRDVIDGVASTNASLGIGSGKVSISVTDAAVTSNFVATTNGGVNLNSVAASGLKFAYDAVVTEASGASSGISADGAGNVSVARNVSINGNVFGTADAPSATGQSLAIRASNGGTIAIGGNVDLTSQGFGAGSATSGTPGGDGIGGLTEIAASDGGQISITGTAQLVSVGYGGSAVATGVVPGSGSGGLVNLLATGGSGSSIAIGAITVTADGYNGQCFSCFVSGGTGQGGIVTIRAAGIANSLSAAGVSDIRAQGLAYSSGTPGSSSNAIGGSVELLAVDGGQIDLNALTVVTNGNQFGGLPGVNAIGGAITISSSGPGGAGVTVSGSADLIAIGAGLDFASPNASDVSGTGGAILINATDGTRLQFDGSLSANAEGHGDFIFAGPTIGTGGHVKLNASSGGTVFVGNATFLNASASGGLNGGAGIGGLAEITLDTGGIIQLTGPLDLRALGAAIPRIDGAPSLGRGGTARIIATAASQFSVTGNASVSAGGNFLGINSGAFDSGVSAEGIGGEAVVNLTGSQATFGGSLDVSATGFGKSGADISGAGIGGTASVTLLDSTLNVAGQVTIDTNGIGAGTSAAGTGGGGVGGSSNLNLTNSNANLLDSIVLTAIGLGGNGAGTGSAAASGAGGQAGLQVNSGTLAVGNTLTMNAQGFGGSGVATAGDGGVGSGGSVTLYSFGGPGGSSVISAGDFQLSAVATGGNGFGVGATTATTVGAAGGRGGNAQGGDVTIIFAPDGGTISGGSLLAGASGLGGAGGSGVPGSALGGAGGRGGDGGSGQGGRVSIGGLSGSSTGTGELNFSSVNLFASGLGGAGGMGGLGAPRGEGGNGGSGIGGNVGVQFLSGNSRMLVSGLFSGIAFGEGGQAGDCDDGCLSAGGSGTGGGIFFGSLGDSSGNTITLGGALTLTTDASGGASQGATGGNATGGQTIMKIGAGQIFNGTELSLTSNAFGGSAASEGTAGSGQGGTASIITVGTGVIGASGSADISTQGSGGAGLGATTIGGAGTGGTSRIFADGGTLSFGQVSASANGSGGRGNQTASSGVGGIGTGGVAEIVTGLQTGGNPNNSTITVLGDASIIDTQVNAFGRGGNGYAAGAGIGGRASVFARQGTMALSHTFIDASGLGGRGTAGGTGGAGIGGVAEANASNNLSGPSRVITTQLDVDAIGAGGRGGSLDTAGTVGGTGGRGQGGLAIVGATAGNGSLEADFANAIADGYGGGGGAGTGAAGGNGGDAVGGRAVLGASTEALDPGSASFGGVLVRSAAFGGDGGAGDSATAGAVGGNGGNAASGSAILLARGSSVTITDNGLLDAIATGGNGGLGFSTGRGGSATVGTVGTSPAALQSGSFAIIANRVGQPTQRGNLVARDLTFTAAATGGSGSTPGTSTYAPGGMQFNVVNSSVTAINLKFTASAASLDTSVAGAADGISLTNATATISGTFDLNTVGATSLRLDQSSLIADSIAITAANWLADPLVPTTLGTLTGKASLSLTSGQDIVAHANLATQGALALSAPGRIDLGAINAFGAIRVTAGSSLTLGDVSSGSSIELEAVDEVLVGTLSAAEFVGIKSQGNVTAGNLSAGTGTPSGVNGDLYTVGIRSGGSVSTGAIFAASDLGIFAANALTTGQATAYDMLLLSGGDVSTGGLEAANRVLIAGATMAGLGETAAGFDKDLVFAGSPVRTAGSINLSAPATASAFTAAAQGPFTSGAITVTPSATGSGDLRIDTGGAITTTNLTAANAVHLVSATSIQTGAVTSQTSDVTFAASAGSVGATGTQTIQTGAITADGAITVAGGSATTVASASASKGLIEVTATGALEIGDATAGVAGVRLIAGSTTASGGLQSGQGSITAGNVQAAGLVQLYAGGAVASEKLRSSSEGVKVASFGGAVRTGDISAPANVLVSAADSLSIGGIIQARDVVLLSGGNVSAGDIFAGAIAAASGGPTTDATGRILIANRSMATDQLLRSAATDYSALLADAPVAVGGSVNVNGNVVAGRFAAFSNGNMTGGRISAAQELAVESGGLVTVAQRWEAPSLLIASSDIRVVDNGSSGILSGLRSIATGRISLTSIGGSPALIGDGLTGSGYALSDAELALVSAGEISIGAIDHSANATDMLIGNLSLTAGGTVGSSNLAGSAGRIVFNTGDQATKAPGGAIRIVGNLTGTGFASTNTIEFNSDRFELDVATGSLSLTQTGTALGGVVQIAADSIHAATGTILDRLATDPFYDGHLTDLDRPAPRQRPDGVLRALGLDLSPKSTLYIQNTGTILDPAGFFADFDSTSLTNPDNGSSSQVSVVVNGQWRTPNGIVARTEAHDLVAENSSSSFFTPDSSVNGCALNAVVCVSELTRDPTPAISSQIQVILNDPIGSTPKFVADLDAPSESGSDYLTETEEQGREAAADEGRATTGPIAPRPQIVDMTSLQAQPQIAQPVTGSGKPSLVGTLADEGLVEGVEK
jgi:hypothetical protein